MAEAVAEEAKPKTKKRSFGKILLLGINVLLFLSGAAFFLLTKFGFLASTTPAEPSQPWPPRKSRQRMGQWRRRNLPMGQRSLRRPRLGRPARPTLRGIW